MSSLNFNKVTIIQTMWFREKYELEANLRQFDCLKKEVGFDNLTKE